MQFYGFCGKKFIQDQGKQSNSSDKKPSPTSVAWYKVNNEVVKKAVYNKLVAKVNAISTHEFVLKTKYDTDILSLEKKINDADKKIPNIIGFAKKKKNRK